VRLAKPVPVAWVYLTGYATPDGTVHFRDDIYGLDALSPPAPQSPEPLDVPVTASITPRRVN
jgi:L,D-transpeptidase YcbB